MNTEIQITTELANQIHLTLIAENVRLKRENNELLEKLYNHYHQDKVLQQYKKHIEILKEDSEILKEENKQLKEENELLKEENKQLKEIEYKIEKLEKKINKLYKSRERKAIKIIIQDINSYLHLENIIPDLYELRMDRNYDSHYIEHKHIKKKYETEYDIDDIKKCYCYYAIQILGNIDEDIKNEMNELYPNVINAIIHELEKIKIDKKIYNNIVKTIKYEAEELLD